MIFSKILEVRGTKMKKIQKNAVRFENLKQDYGKDYKRTTIRTFVLHLEEKGYVTTYQIGKYSYINYLIEEQDYKEQELEKTKNFWYKESGFDLVKTLYKGKLNEGKLKKLKKLLEEIDD